jgi:putative Holliday junction resolvase
VKLLAFDHGRARTGVAVTDPTGTLVRPLPAITRVDSPAGLRELDAVVAREQPERIIVGEPLLMSGERGAQARSAAGFADRIRGRFGIPVELVDERLSTREAARRIAEAGPRRGTGPDLDSAAACVLLEAIVGYARTDGEA